MRALTLFSIALALGSTAWGQSLEAPHTVLLRFTSATWCHYCQVVKKSLVQSGYLKASGSPFLMKGQMVVEVDGRPVQVQIEQVEADLARPVDCKSMNPALVVKVPYYPYVRIFLDGDEIYAGSRSEIGGDEKFAGYNDAAGIKTRLVALLRAYLAGPTTSPTPSH